MALPDVSLSLLDAAIHFAERGWPVFPCNPANKRPYLPRDRDGNDQPIKGTGGVSKATTDVDQIRAWWRKWPRAMIGLSVGKAGLLVIDFDPRRDEIIDQVTGEVTYDDWTLERLKAELEAQMGCALPVSLAVRTPSGGVHVYFLMPPGKPIGNRGNLPHHVDVRGDGGYVIVPPSTSDKGDYHWLRGDADAEIAEMPAQLVEILRASPAKARRDDTPPPRHSAPKFAVDLDEAHRKWALSALDRELAELANTPKGGGRHGGRNRGAYEAAYALGTIVGAGALSETVVRHSLIEVVRGFDPGAFDSHVSAIDNGLSNGMANPRDLSAVATQTRGRAGGRSASPSRQSAPLEAYADDWGGPGPQPGGEEFQPFQSGSTSDANPDGGQGGRRIERIRPDPDDVLDRKCAFFPMTDLGNAERFRARHGWRFRFCAELGWFIWDDRRWKLLSEEKDKVPGEVSLAVFETVRAIGNEADLIEGSGAREEDPDDPERLDFIVDWKGRGDEKQPIMFSSVLRSHAKASEGSGRIGCIAPLAKAFTDIAITADAMDRDRMAINVLNGTIRLAVDGNRPVLRLDPHRPDDLISKIANVVYDPKAECPTYDGFLATVQPDESIRRFLHQWGGLSLTGDIGEQKLVFHHGGGRNGKSTLNDLWGTLAGDYGATIAIETFLDQGRGRKGGEATPDLARLPGVRFLRTSEPEKGAKLAEALIKLVTGGEPIDARHLNKGFFTFLPSFKLSVQGNHKPKITGHDDGIWRRMMLVPWAVQIPKDQVDTKLPDKLRGELSGVFNRLLAGLLDWKMEGLIAPDAVIEATAKYREQSDQLGRFISECCVVEDGATAPSAPLLALFNAWCKATGAAEWQAVGFSRAMEDRGFEKKTSNGVKWLGIKMVKGVEDYAEGSGSYAPRREDDDGPPPRPTWRDDDDVPL